MDATSDRQSGGNPQSAIRNLQSCDFQFALFQTVAFVDNPDVTGEILGRMEDRHGRRYELKYIVQGRTLRRWFPEGAIAAASRDHVSS